jgi:hypothetical protein
LPCVSLQSAPYSNRQEPKYAGLHHQFEEQAVSNPFETLERLSNTTTTAL